jgi:hypothetical protein
MQSTAGQSFAGRVHRQEMKRRIILRITLAAGSLTPHSEGDVGLRKIVAGSSTP